MRARSLSNTSPCTHRSDRSEIWKSGAGPSGLTTCPGPTWRSTTVPEMGEAIVMRLSAPAFSLLTAPAVLPNNSNLACATLSAQARWEWFGKTAGAVRRLKAGADRRITIASPISGTVVERQVGPGQVVKPDGPAPLFQISDLSDLWVHGDVFESDLARIRLGAPAKISVESYPNRVFPARVSFINPTVDPVTRTVHVRCRVSNPRGLLKPEMFARMTIVAAA